MFLVDWQQQQNPEKKNRYNNIFVAHTKSECGINGKTMCSYFHINHSGMTLIKHVMDGHINMPDIGICEPYQCIFAYLQPKSIHTCVYHARGGLLNHQTPYIELICS